MKMHIIRPPVVPPCQGGRRSRGVNICSFTKKRYKLFNEREENEITEIYDVVPTGEIWKFLNLSGERVQINLAEYFLNDVAKIMGILTNAVK